MSTSEPQSTPGQQPTEEELRAAYEDEIRKIRVEQVLLEHVVTLINLGMRRTGLAPGTEAERDPGQVQIAIESVRVLLPVIETVAPAQAKPIRDALSQLQLAFVRLGGPAPAGAPEPGAPVPPHPEAEAGNPPAPPGPAGPGSPDPPAPEPGEAPGPAQRSGRLWIPGQ